MWDYGNPGEKYANTRHNMGFMAIDRLAEKLNIEINKKKFKGMFGEGNYNGQKVVLLKPETYMNLSGEAVKEIVDFYKIIPSNELIVIYDDIDIEPGKIRVKPEGSSGTHNGMRNITDMLDTHDYMRIRVGTGKPFEQVDLAEYVLMNLTDEEIKVFDESTDRAAEAVVTIIKDGIEKAMNLYN